MIDYFQCPDTDKIYIKGQKLTTLITGDKNRGWNDFRLIVATCQNLASDTSIC